MLSFLREFWIFLRVRKKFWLLPVYRHDGHLRRPDRADARARPSRRSSTRCSERGRRECASSESRRSITTARPRWSRTAASSRRRRRSASPARSTIPAFPHTPSPIAWTTAGVELDDVDHVVFYDKPFLKFERLLETYLASRRAGFRLLPHGDAALAAGEAVPEERCCATS